MVQTVNVTLDDYSPVIDYEPSWAWTDGSTADPFWNSYTNNGTFTLTTTFGASASLSFNGTGVWIYGAKRSNHGPYNVTLDGTTYFDNGYYDGQVFQQILFSAVGLDGTTPHLVTIANSRVDAIRPYLDIDSIVYQMELPDDYEEVKQQDTASNFQYSESGWSTNPNNLGSYDGNTGHSTSLGGASVNYTFQGSHVELYGIVGPFGGLFTVQIDNGPGKTLNASRTKFTPKTVLYQESGLGSGNHTLRVTNAPFSGQTLSIDYVVVGQSPNSTEGISPSPSAGSSSSSQLSGGVIGGIVAGISGFLFIVMGLLLLWYRRRHRRPHIIPHDVLHAEFANNGTDLDPGDSSTRLTPFLSSTITRYNPSSPAPVSFPSKGYDSQARGGPSLYPSSYLSESVPGSSSTGLAVENAGGHGDGGAGGNRYASDAAEEKRRIAAAMRERDRQMESGEQGFETRVSSLPRGGGGNGVMLPDYYQATAQPLVPKRR